MKKEKKTFSCNICGLPGFIKYKVTDPETGKVTEERMKVPCLGHQGIHPALWNMSADYNKYQKFIAQRHKECNNEIK